ncbi:hypothetical protein F2Q70_00037986 [Brassica cretica]|uniref:Uncharacterized protein n=1 Tax=Brassica cretica TaxID=69181 RepID=A0A8S9K5T4_BRACR|nr:hypothetical protein F2Q70_00037986 [Brassica cretica]
MMNMIVQVIHYDTTMKLGSIRGWNRLRMRFSSAETLENRLIRLSIETFDIFSRQMKHTHELERGELKELVDPVGSRFTSTIATAGTTLILGYGLGWRGGIWYANRKFKREQMRLAGQLKPREWKLLLGRIKPRAWPTSRLRFLRRPFPRQNKTTSTENALKTPPPEGAA